TYPVRGATVKEVGDAHARGERPDLATRAPRGSKTLAAVIGRAIQPDPSRRFDSARAMLRALEDVQRRGAQRRKPYWFALGAVSLAAVVLAVVPVLTPRSRGRSGSAPYFGTTAEKRAVRLPPAMTTGKPSPDGRYLPLRLFLASRELRRGRQRGRVFADAR